MNINHPNLTNEILSKAANSGIALFQIILIIDNHFPEQSLGSKFNLATALVKSLLKNQLVVLTETAWDEDKNAFVEEYAVIDPDVDELLSNPTTWYPWYCSCKIGIKTTDAKQPSSIEHSLLPYRDIKIDLAKLEYEVLSWALDEFTGLYIVVWILNGQYPNMDLGFKYDAAKEVVTSLYKKGWISISEEHWDKKHNRQITTLNDFDIDVLLSKPDSWHPVYSDGKVCESRRLSITPTELGEKQYYSK
jgi:hypothetical protein